MLSTLNRNNRLMMVALFVWALGEGLWYYNLRQLYLAELGAIEAQIGLVLALESIFRAAMPIPAGYLSDRFGARRVMVASWLLGIAGPVLVALATTWQLAIPGLMIYAMSSFAIPAISTYAIKNIAARDRGMPGITDRVLATVYAVYPAGLILSPTAGGLLAEAFSIRTAIWASAGIFIVSTMIVLRTKHVNVEPASVNDRPRDLLQNGAFMRLAVFYLIALVAMYTGYQLLPNYLHEVRGLTFARIGVLFSVAAAGTVVINLLAGRLNPRWNIAAVMGVYGLALGSIWLGASPVALAGGLFGVGALSVVRTLATARTAEVVSQRNQGLAFGAIETVVSIALGLGAGLAGQLYGATTEHTLPFIVPVAATPLLIGLWFVLRSSLPEQSKLVGEPSSSR